MVIFAIGFLGFAVIGSWRWCIDSVIKAPRHLDQGVPELSLDVHVEQTGSGMWKVAGGNIRGRYRFALRDHALAYSRAFASSKKVNLYVHEAGAVVQQSNSSLTYPTALD